MIEINGSVGEAGGQVLRTACALSAITKNLAMFLILDEAEKSQV